MSSPSLHSSSLKGLYVILDAQALRGRSLVDALNEAASGGVRLFQYRDKASPAVEMYRQAIQLRRAAADVGALFLVNDRCDLALAVDADGVHLGQDDLPPSHARRVLGAGKIIGVSTHEAGQVRDATEGGADYLGFGPIFPTATKPHHEPVVGIEGLRLVRPLTRLPIFAIGGLTLDGVEAVVGAGANGVAVVSAILDSPDIAGAVRAFMAHFS